MQPDAATPSAHQAANAPTLEYSQELRPLAAAQIRNILNTSALAPKTLIEIVWLCDDGKKITHWIGYAFEPTGRSRDRRSWCVEYRWTRGPDGQIEALLDDDGDPSLVSSTLPRSDVPVLQILFPEESVTFHTPARRLEPQPTSKMPERKAPPTPKPKVSTPPPQRPPELHAAAPVATRPTQAPAVDAPSSPPAADPEDGSDDSDDEWDQLGFPSPALVQGFREGRGASVLPVTLMTAREFRDLLDGPTPRLPHIVDQGLAKDTRAAHRRMLNFVTSTLQPSDRPLAPALLEMIQRSRVQRAWKCSTTMRYLASLQGALALLPLYRIATAPVLLNEDPVWRQALKSAALHAKEEAPRQPEPATLSDVRKAISLEKHLGVKVAILLAWVTCARVGCILQLRLSDLAWSDNPHLAITFNRGKGVRFRGPYTVHTVLSPAWARLLKRWSAARKTTLFPAQVTGVQVKLALRRSRPNLEQRSLRRGSLQHLAEQTNITEEQLLLFSGHTSVATLRRYLNWGLKGRDRKQMMQCAARALNLDAVPHPEA